MFSPKSNVRVTKGVYKGKSGVVIHETPRKLKVRLDDGVTTGLLFKESVAPFSFGDGDSTPKTKRVNVPEVPAAAPAAAAPTPSTVQSSGGTYEEPPLWTDPSVVAAVFLLLFKLRNSTDYVADLRASNILLPLVFFFVSRVNLTPAAVRLCSSSWRKANLYLVAATAYLHVAVGIVAAPSNAERQTEGLCAFLFLFVMAPLCCTAYRATIRQSPSAHAAGLVANTVQFVTLAFLWIKCPAELSAYLDCDTSAVKIGTSMEDVESMVPVFYVYVVLPVGLALMAHNGINAWDSVTTV